MIVVRGCLAVLVVFLAACDDNGSPGTEAGVEAGVEAGLDMTPDAGPDLQPDTSNLCGPEGEICGGQCVNWKYIMSCGDCPKHCVTYWLDCGDGTCYCELTPNMVCDGGPGDALPDGPPDASPDASDASPGG